MPNTMPGRDNMRPSQPLGQVTQGAGTYHVNDKVDEVVFLGIAAPSLRCAPLLLGIPRANRMGWGTQSASPK